MKPEELFKSSDTEDIKPIIFTKSENGLWFNEDFSVASSDRYNIPPGLATIFENIGQLNKVSNLEFIELDTVNQGKVSLAKVQSYNNRVSFYSEEYIKALSVMFSDEDPSPDLYLINSNKLIIEHSTGFILICPVTLERHKPEI